MDARETARDRYCAELRATLDGKMEEHPLIAGAASGEYTLVGKVEELEGRFEAEMPSWKEALTFSGEARERAGAYIAEVGSLVDAINAASSVALPGWQAEPLSKQPGMFGRAFGEKNSVAAGAGLISVGYGLAIAAGFALNPVVMGIMMMTGYALGGAGGSTFFNGLFSGQRRKAIEAFFGRARERATETDRMLHLLYAPEVVARNPEAFAESYAGMSAGEQEYLRETLRGYVQMGALDIGEARLEKLFAASQDDIHQMGHTG